MSVLLAVVAAAALCASAGGGYLFASMRKSTGGKGERDKEEDERGEKAGGDEARRKRKEDERTFEELPVCLGDVIVADGEERWLAGGLVAREGNRVIAAVFFAPEGAQTTTVIAFARPRREILWLAPARADSPGEPPAACEIGGVAMTRRSRLPVTLSRHGQGAPALGEVGMLAEYEGGADEVAVLVTSEGHAHAWMGRRLGETEYDRLGSGGEDS